MTSESTNTLLNAIDNADPAAVNGPNGLQLCCAPFDEPPFDDMTIVLHDRFLTVAKESDSDTIDLTEPGAVEEAAQAIVSLSSL